MYQTLFYARYNGSALVSLDHGSVYAIVNTEHEDMYGVVDETEGTYLFSRTYFDVIEKSHLSENDINHAEDLVTACNDNIELYGEGNY
jgi:hypothetical protein